MGWGGEVDRQPALSPTDVITHHGHGGRIVHASGNTEAVLGARASDLQSYGLFDRIHIADRPAYLRALSEAAASRHTCEIEFRLRREAKPGFTWIEIRGWSSGVNLNRSGRTTRADVLAV